MKSRVCARAVVSKVLPKPRSPVESETMLRLKPEITIESHEAAEHHLLELGRMLGYLTYCADKSKNFNGKPLAEVSMLQELPPFASERDMSIARAREVKLIILVLSQSGCQLRMNLERCVLVGISGILLSSTF